MENAGVQPTVKKKNLKIYIPLAMVLIAVMIGVWVWYADYSKYYSTDDAYLDSDKVAVSPKILGRIARLYAAEGDTVKAGTLLVLLDSSDLCAQKMQAEAARDQAISNLAQSKAKYQMDEKSIRVQEIACERAKEDYDRAVIQFKGKVITSEQYDHMTKSYESAKAQAEAARSQLLVSQAQIATAESTVKTAQAQIETLETNLRNTRIYSPASGKIAKRWQLTGDVVQPGQPVFTITTDSVIWVAAFFEETKIGGIHLGQKSVFKIDAFPGVNFEGKVINISTNTASQFSLIPPNNASGNFTKVTQRVPIKVSVESCDASDKDVLKHLLAGMSVVIKIVK